MENEWIGYFIRITLFHGACYALYWTLLRRSSWFAWNRAYLVGTLLLGFVAPAIVVPLSLFAGETLLPEINVSAGTFSEGAQLPSNISASPQYATSYAWILAAVYLSGVLFLLLRAVQSLLWIHRLKARYAPRPNGPANIIRIKEPLSFSFLRTIFLQEGADDAVLLHEEGHVKGRHWLDLIFIETVSILAWPNPVIRLYRKSLKQQHEYLADDYVLQRGVTRHAYLTCILRSLSFQRPIGLIHTFNSHSLKQRIFMITTDQNASHARWKLLLVVPLTALLFFSFAGSGGQPTPVAEKIIVVDAAHGGSDAGSVSPSGIAEKEIALSLAKLVSNLGRERGLNILLTRTSDEPMSLQQRVEFSVEAKADLFLSLHIGADAGSSRNAAMYVSAKGANPAESRRLAAALGKELGTINELGSPGIHNSGAFILEKAVAPSAILELGYLSDEDYSRFISQSSNQRRVAEKIVNALSQY